MVTPLNMNISFCNRFKTIAVFGLFLSIIFATPLYSQNNTPSIIPIPVSLEQGSGEFELTAETTIIIAGENPEISGVADYLSNKIKPATGYGLETKNNGSTGIILTLLDQTDDEIGDEGYHLSVDPENITIKANKPAGLFYGVQTLLQLLPKDIENDTVQQDVDWDIPAVEITDYPRFGWRGLMLDVSRHFFPKEAVKEFIDDMARYKYNRFHWHLSDDQGWRIEIKSLPKLTEIGAWRVGRHGEWGKREAPKPGEKATYGGYYTHEDIKEVVQYAQDRFIEILPEIDVPGHSMAAIAAYPELSVTEDPSITVNPGSKFSTWHGNGKFTMHVDNSLDPSNEKVYIFLDKVFTEVAALFPFEYIHMGGDEAYKGYWEKDPDNQALMKKMKMENSVELQSYFNKRVNQIIRDKGKKMIGWDEILEGGLPEGATVMSWRGTKGGIEAAHQNAPVVMSPSPMAYLDLYQGDPAVEPPTYSMARLKGSYTWDPVPEGVDSELILGGQGNIWAERLPTKTHVEYMAYPRAFALAEVYWSPKKMKDWESFVSRVEDHFERFDEAEINYAISMYDPIIKVSKNNDGDLVINLSTEVEGLDLHYAFDQGLPNNHFPKYNAPIVVPKGSDLFMVVSYEDGEQAGKLISIPIEDLEKRVKK